jgi:class 3 adenylate cyclase
MGGGPGGTPAELPAGTVTMLFTDMEGSTRLLARLGDRYGELLSAQRAVQRDAYRRHHGTELGTEGDSFFVVFGSAADAVAACADAQRGLAAYPWPPGAAPRIRMGLHTGEPTRHEDGYIGMDVHLAARIAATAHGGQVVLSDPVRQLAGARIGPDGLADLGWHRLKDITEPEHIFQLLIAGLPAGFPPLKSLGNRSSLPEPPTRCWPARPSSRSSASSSGVPAPAAW